MSRLREADVPSSALPGLENKPGKTNWVEKAGGLPPFITRIAKHLQAKGRTESAAIATAVSQAKKVCATGLTFGGKVKVSAAARGRYCEAVAQWEAKRGKAKTSKAARSLSESEAVSLAEMAAAELGALVERHGAEPVLEMALVEAEGGGDLSRKARGKAAEKGYALPDGSYPIRNASELSDAIDSVGRAKDYDRARRHVIKRARALGLTGKLPAKWGVTEELAERIAELSAILEVYGGEELREASYAPPAWAVPTGSKSITAKGTRIGSKGDPEAKRGGVQNNNSDFNSKHPRGGKGSSAGGKFVRKGDTGRDVKAVASLLGVQGTGDVFTANLAHAVRDYQRKHGLQVDGVVGRQTATSLLGGGKVAVGELTDHLSHRLRRRSRAKSSS